MKVELLADGYTFLEGPRVDSRNNLYFSDIVIGGVFRRTPDGKITHLIPDRKMIGGLCLNADGRLVVSGRGGLVLVHETTGKMETLLDTVEGTPVSSINDIQPDGEGGLYAGLIDAASQTGQPGEAQPLVLLSSNRRARRVAEGIKVTNGIGISPDRRTVYQVETKEGVLAYDRAADGSLSNKRLAVNHPWVDGMTVDSEGCIWVAALFEAAVVRFTPDGKRDRQIDVPIKPVASLTFGGEDLRDMYVVTGSNLGEPNYEHTGHVYRIRTDVTGQPTPLTRF